MANPFFHIQILLDSEILMYIEVFGKCELSEVFAEVIIDCRQAEDTCQNQ